MLLLDHLKNRRGMTAISADDLIARNPQAFEKSGKSAIRGFDPRLDPAVNGLVEAALSTAGLSKGLVLVGYPAEKAQGDYLVSPAGKAQFAEGAGLPSCAL